MARYTIVVESDLPLHTLLQGMTFLEGVTLVSVDSPAPVLPPPPAPEANPYFRTTPGGKHRLNDAGVAFVEAEFAKGTSVTEIAKAIGLHFSAVHARHIHWKARQTKTPA